MKAYEGTGTLYSKGTDAIYIVIQEGTQKTFQYVSRPVQLRCGTGGRQSIDQLSAWHHDGWIDDRWKSDAN